VKAGSHDRGCVRRDAKPPERPPSQGREREHRRLPPEDLRRRDRSETHRLDLDIGASRISVDLQEHVADPERRALPMCNDDLDRRHPHLLDARLVPCES